MSTELDVQILEPFQEIFEAMNIRTGQIILSAKRFSSTLTPEELRELSEGKPLDEKILSAQGELQFSPAPFEYKNNIVLVYQRDQYLTRENYAQDNYTRFHLCFCEALRDAKTHNRLESRYVMTFDTSGNFLVNLFLLNGEKREQNVYRRLKVCQHCLRELNWKNFRKYCGTGRMTWKGGNRQMRQKIADEFDIAEYLLSVKENFAEFPPLNCVTVTPIKEYVLSPEVKAALKRNADYSCDFCRQQFTPDELEIHHRNHNQGDNRRDNLLVLCTSCHNMIHVVEGGTFTEQRLRNTGADELKLFCEVAAVNGNKSNAQKFRQRAIAAYKKLSPNNLDALFELATLSKPADAKKLFGKYLSWAKRLKHLNFRESVRVALLYAKGLGTIKNLTEARKYFSTARKCGKPEDFVNIEFIELCKLLGLTDEARRLYDLAIESLESALTKYPNEWAACYELAKVYGDETLMRELLTEGLERLSRFWATKPDNLDAVKRLKESARAGNEAAQNTLERLYTDADKRRMHQGMLVLREGTTVIEANRFRGQRGISHVAFPDSLIEIGDEAFRGCGLRTLVLPASLKKIGKFAFADSTEPVEEITYPRQIEPLLKEHFGDRWDEIKKTRLP